ncbi:hypothetical protein MRX96_013857, partial [Rhipicephalus microplus]
MATASFASFAAAPLAPPTYHWPLHPAALDPSYFQNRQYSSMNGATRLLPVPAIGSPASTVPGKPVAVGAAQAGTYGSAHQVATTAGAKEPLMDIRSGSSTFKALLDTGSSISIFGLHATAAARASGAKPKANVRVVRLASGWSQSTMSLKCPIEWAAGCRRQQFLCVPDQCRDVVLGSDFLTVSGISALVTWWLDCRHRTTKNCALCQGPLKNSLRQWKILETVCAAFLPRAMPACASAPEATAACNVIIPGHSSDIDSRMTHVLEEFNEIFTTTPGCTTLSEHRIDTGGNPTVRCKLRRVNAKKQAIMNNCIHDLLAQNLIRPSQSQHASAPVLVEKKSGGYRMDVDYRQLNARTKVPVYPVPRTDWLLAQLGRA